MSLAAQAHFGDYTPTDFGWPHQVPDLVPLQFDGVSFGSCARDAHGVFTALLTELVPHIKGGLHAGSCGAYSTTDDLPDGSWSFHRYGIAIDVNWNVNKMGVPRAARGRYAIPHKIASQIARKYGCEYGGDWTNPKDWMHFEIHLSPQVARTVTADSPYVQEDDMDISKFFRGADKKPHQVRTLVRAELQPLLKLAADQDKRIAQLQQAVAELSKGGAVTVQPTDVPATLHIGRQQ